MHLTFHTSVEDQENHAALAAMARYHSMVERKLYAEIAAGKYKIKSFKPAFSAAHGLTSRQFNSMMLEVKGKIDGTRECLKDNADVLRPRVKIIDKAIGDLTRLVETKIDAKGRVIGKAKLAKKMESLHEKKRKQARLVRRIQEIECRIKANVPGIAFGGKKLFREQFKPGADHGHWLDTWRAARDAQFILIGSADENGGCQSCLPTLEEDGTLTLRLRPFNHMLTRRAQAEEVPSCDRMQQKFIKAKADDFITIRGVKFGYGQRYIHDVVLRNQSKDKAERTPLTWRFLRGDNGRWYVHISFNVQGTAVFDCTNGAAGVDFNEDHIAVSIVDKHGNFVTCRRFDLNLYGVPSLRAKDMIRCAARDVVAWVKSIGLSIVGEDLDFQKKKKSMETLSAKRSRKLSSLHYADWGKALKSRCLRDGVALKHVNPAYSSLIGRVKFSTKLGLSIHHAAAMVIARRGMDLSERLPRTAVRYPAGKGAHVTLNPAVSMGHRHVWASWARVAKTVNAAHVALLSAETAARRRQRTMAAAMKLSLDDIEPNFHELLDVSIPWRNPGATPGRRPDHPVDGRIQHAAIAAC